MLVERYGLGELADGAADHGREAEARREQGADDEEQGKYGGHAPALQPEHGRCGDGRDEHREQEGHEHCLGGAEARHDDHDARENEHVARPRGEAFEGFHGLVLRERCLGGGTFRCTCRAVKRLPLMVTRAQHTGREKRRRPGLPGFRSVKCGRASSTGLCE